MHNECTHPHVYRAHGCSACYFARPRAKTQPTATRFWSKVDKDGPIPAHRPELGPCWMWTAYTDRKGYGQFRLNGKTINAHRWPYEQAHGQIPDGLQPDHLCRNPPCVRDDHLEAVTSAVNTQRGLSGARQRARTHCPQGHPYDEANTYRSPRGRRACRICGRQRLAARYRQRKSVAR